MTSPELSTTNKTPMTNDNVQGNLPHDYEKKKIAHISKYLPLIKLCSNVGITKTVANGQYFTTLDDAKLDKLESSRRECTFPRDRAASNVKGWIRGNTKIGPALEVAVSHHQGHYGIEIMTESLFDDGTCSCVMIVNGINEYVTEMSEEAQENHIDDIGDSTGKPVVKARSKETSILTTSSPAVTLPYLLREWIDVEPGQHDKNCFEVSEKMIRLLRHDPSVRREEDGSVEFRILAPMFR